jgi:hypothetical protein
MAGATRSVADGGSFKRMASFMTVSELWKWHGRVTSALRELSSASTGRNHQFARGATSHGLTVFVQINA